MKRVFLTDKAPQAIGPYSQAVLGGNLVFVSGQIPLQPGGSMEEGSIEDQTKQIMENIKAILETTDTEMRSIVKATIYLTDLGDFEKVNEVYGSYFENEPPARSTVQVAGLPKGARVEIEAIAFIN
jgi:2-iminobutanoate/2-iminopropanoate deaminase